MDEQIQQSIKLRVIVSEDDIRKLSLPHGLPETVQELENTVRAECNVHNGFILQYLDHDFKDFVNITLISDVRNKGTLKVVIKHPCQKQRVKQAPQVQMIAQSSSLMIQSLQVQGQKHMAGEFSSPNIFL